MQISPYGTWPSPLTTDALVADSLRLSEVALDGDTVWWVEGRPAEGGRQALMRARPGGAPEDMLPAPYSVRTRVHEYGGAALCVAGGRVWFCNDADQRIYALGTDGTPTALTAEGPWRYAEAQFDANRNQLIAVRESHTGEGHEPSNELVAIDADSGAVRLLASGHDFYAAPRITASGAWVTFITWDHPRMPWDGTDLWLLSLDGDTAPRHVVGGPDESVLQPLWAPDGSLCFVSDRSGWWNLYSLDVEADASVAPRCLVQRNADFAKPHWQFGNRTYGFAGPDRLVAAWADDGSWRLTQHDLSAGTAREIDVGYTEFDCLWVSGDLVACAAGAPDVAGGVVRLGLADGQSELLRESASLPIDKDHLSIPRSIWFESGGMQVHAFFYAPTSGSHAAPDGERPPLIVIGHGGPTGGTSSVLNTRVQFWTSRGFAVVDVNYRGSTGFGRVYRDALKEQWGIADVEDCVNAARHLAAEGLVDGDRLAIRGGSAGGFTTLAALVFHDTFKAGASYYGISELEALATDTHKFESRYLDSLIGPYPETRSRYIERSPIQFTDQLNCPVIFFQGLEDKVVPPNQAEMMVEALRAKGLPVAYLAFEGEQHGFRMADTIRRTLEAELYFYGRVFGFEPADAIEPVPIDNL
ncbi:MAG: prolyl oligopeptidase family serine peptidase [Pseudomonadota bacterium]